ncbi:MAG: peptidylprolyl isomerase [Candidatus Bathyarchaeota archaeon]|nr:MAG: peptidylprolyl isomerase [Candidatus Bathyarchaeota archaeon]
MSISAIVVIVIAGIFTVSLVGAGYYIYVVPHPSRLRILHNQPDPMINEIIADFKEWYRGPVEVTLTRTDPETAYEKATTAPWKPNAEIWWGGPLSLFEKAGSALLAYNATPFVNGEIDETCYSCPLVDLSQNTPRWYAASLYGLGVMYNEDHLISEGLSKPQSWADLTLDKYEGNMTMTDPIMSELMSPFVMLILESEDWTNGWEYLVKLSAFIRHYDANEIYSTWQVTSNFLPLAVVPDSKGFDAMMVSAPHVSFSYLGATIVQPDPIGIFAKGTHLDEAKAFVDYVLTERAQNIIGKYRLPMHRDATEFPSEYSPFDQNFPHVEGYNQTLQEIIGDYYQTWITERHDLIRTAWDEIKEIDKPSHDYTLAWNNFTYAGYYADRSEIEAIYNKTDNWTNAQDMEIYMNEWRGNSTIAYQNAANQTIVDENGPSATRVLLSTNMGDITIELYDDMPITTGNFKNLTQQGIYDDTIFHRVISGFMIQGGDPTGTGYGDPSIPAIPDEFTDHNRNERGTIAMANAGPNTGSSQFFINLVDNSHLDSAHPVFGKVIQGMDVVDNIAGVETDENDRPLEEVRIIKAELVN